MTTPKFSGKLDALPATLDLLEGYDPQLLAGALSQGKDRNVLAIGSGGSAVAAEYLARCRDTLGYGPTLIQTPMQAVLELHGLDRTDVWLFSAGSDNADVAAAAKAALDRHCASLHLVTRNPHGSAVEVVGRGSGTTHVVPVADRKDGYLATHSLLATSAALLLASDRNSPNPQGTKALVGCLTARMTAARDPEARSRTVDAWKSLGSHDTIVIAADPLLRPLAVLLDTSVWEAAICPVQTTDIRNFAHGRHAWLHHRGRETFILALTGCESRAAWAAIDAAIPDFVRRLSLDHGTCGRLEGVLSLIDGLGLIEALGTVRGIDPGKPGMGEFGREIYADRSLADTASQLPPAVRQKRAAMARVDRGEIGDNPLALISQNRLEVLAASDVGGLVLDYDGTIVSTHRRTHPPDAAIVGELIRLYNAGLAIGIATGRGGSAGQELRKIFPPNMAREILIGYYNGGHLRTADVDIAADPAPTDPGIEEVAEWLRNRPDLFAKYGFRQRGVQITVEMDALQHPFRFALDLSACPALTEGRVRIVGSGHSFDIIPAASSKLVVAAAMRSALRTGTEILCIGDSGSRNGNDHAFLSHPFGISVGDVCDAPDGCWSLFGTAPVGPEALLKLLRALMPSRRGGISLDITSLALDSHGR
ncbi:Hydroxymethylpyrimidine pyrophosphatase [Methylobacterium sp. ap11]|uniref:hypothetical protein n=1 Tax=Methylobacterium sp. ap11 TaxID=1761799 RepID=UPI0008BEC81F|nr:hypothetical protein [Methylobacterium sp. ap11]SEP41107.1 Hydroxymethylpyrimidine pyrophosphatase [Methylobacterium sp. ap11]